MLRSTATMEGLDEYLSWSSTNPVNISSGRKPEYPEKTHDSWQSVDQLFSHDIAASPNRDSHPRSQRWKTLALTAIAPPKPHLAVKPLLRSEVCFLLQIAVTQNRPVCYPIHDQGWTAKMHVSTCFTFYRLLKFFPALLKTASVIYFDT